MKKTRKVSRIPQQSKSIKRRYAFKNRYAPTSLEDCNLRIAFR